MDFFFKNQREKPFGIKLKNANKMEQVGIKCFQIKLLKKSAIVSFSH